MQVGVPDGRVIPVESDPATSAWEICLNLANTIGLKDHFGFSIYVGVQRKVFGGCTSENDVRYS